MLLILSGRFYAPLSRDRLAHPVRREAWNHFRGGSRKPGPV